MTVLKTSPTLRPKELAISAIGATGIYVYHNHMIMCCILWFIVYQKKGASFDTQPASTAVQAGKFLPISGFVKKPALCIGENKDTDQLCC